MKWLIFAVALPGLCCGMLLKKTAPTEIVIVSGTVIVHKPYCGGAAPGPEQRNGFDNPLANTGFYLRTGTTNDKTNPIEATFETDENGQFSVDVEPGAYSVFHSDKRAKYADFRKKKASTSKNYKERDETCFENWYNQPDFVLTVHNDTTVAFRYSARCFEGTNPCLNYEGPYPP